MPVPVYAARHPRRLLRDLTFDTIRDAIVDGTLAPGERLFEDDLATWLGVSKTPVKEALARLSSHDLVQIEANRYTRVATADVLDLLDTLELIGVLHAEAVRTLPRSASAGAGARADRLVSVLDAGPTCTGIVRASGAFLDLARNPLVRRAAEPLHVRAAFLCRHLSVDWSRPSLVARLADLRDALEARDWPRTADALAGALRRTALQGAVEVVPAVAETTSLLSYDGSAFRARATSVAR